MNDEDEQTVINPWGVLAWTLNVVVWAAAPAGLAILWSHL